MTTIVVVGGFLGAGKTTLILSAAKRLIDAGKRVAVITNDRAGELVDTRLVRASALAAEEVAGGCFCCRFRDFADAAGKLMSSNPEVIFAEPVGSCADLAATVLEPLRRMYGSRFRLAPYSVVADPPASCSRTAPTPASRTSSASNLRKPASCCKPGPISTGSCCPGTEPG